MTNKFFAAAVFAAVTGVTTTADAQACGTTPCGTSGNTYNTQNISQTTYKTDSNAVSTSSSSATGGSSSINMGAITTQGGQGGAGGQGGQGGSSAVQNAGNSSVENKVKSTVLGVGSPAIASVATRCGDVIRGTSFTLSIGAPVFGIGGGVGQTTRETTMPELEKCIAKEYLLAADTETRCLGLEAHREIFAAYQEENPEARPSALVTAYERRNICAAPFAAVATPVPAAAVVQNNWVEQPNCKKGFVWNQTAGACKRSPD